MSYASVSLYASWRAEKTGDAEQEQQWINPLVDHSLFFCEDRPDGHHSTLASVGQTLETGHLLWFPGNQASAGVGATSYLNREI